MSSRRALHFGELLISLALVALGGFVLLETRGIAEGQGYAQVGPRLFPFLIGAGMALCGMILAGHALSGGWRNVPLDQEAHDAADRAGFLTVSAGILIHMLVIGTAGFVIASTLLFSMVARGFGSRRTVRDALFGLALALVAYLVFTFGLQLRLPAGPFDTRWFTAQAMISDRRLSPGQGLQVDGKTG